MKGGTVEGGTVEGGTVQDRTVEGGTVQDRTVEGGTVQDRTVDGGTSKKIWQHVFWLAPTGAMLIVCLSLLSVWRLGSQWTERLTSGIAGLLNPPAPVAQVEETRAMILQQIKGVSELTTAVLTMESVVPTKSDRILGNYVIGTTRLLYIAHGEVRAGIDLSDLAPEDITLVNNTLQIQLPPPVIIDHKVDVERSRVYDYDRGFLSLGPDVAPDLQTLAQRETLDQLVMTACDNQLLEEANQRAIAVLSQLFSVSGDYETITVNTQPPTPETCAVQES
ncbi:MAG: DUF4230 domain-containing protein [Cyanothece sp. SIO2G6]|nr:DUF4230 domain-containing protein [Cyanothece sp. SIO2G6]